jgi:hypothetical protein
MSYYQDVVVEYLRADRARFVNTEYLIQLNPNNESKGTFWYCDAVAVSFSDSTIYLCEVTYSKTMTALIKRLRAWSANWSGVRAALIRDAQIPNPKDWAVKLWLFVPAKHEPLLRQKLTSVPNVGIGDDQMPTPEIRTLESVTPWNHGLWDKKLAVLGEQEETARLADA